MATKFFAWQEQFNIISLGENVHSNAKHFYCSCYVTWPPCKNSIRKSCTALYNLFMHSPLANQKRDILFSIFNK